MLSIPPPTPRPPELPGARILVITADPAMMVALTSKLARSGATVTVVTTGEAARLEAGGGPGFDAAMLDSNLPEVLPELVDQLQYGERGCAVIGFLRSERAADAPAILGSGAFEVLEEPWRATDIVTAAVRARRETRRRRGTTDTAPPRLPPHDPPPAPPSSGGVPGLERAVSALGTSVSLSPREVGVLRLLAMGYRYEDIGRELDISPRTVKMHASNVRKKAGVSNRQQLLAKVFKQ